MVNEFWSEIYTPNGVVSKPTRGITLSTPEFGFHLMFVRLWRRNRLSQPEDPCPHPCAILAPLSPEGFLPKLNERDLLVTAVVVLKNKVTTTALPTTVVTGR